MGKNAQLAPADVCNRDDATPQFKTGVTYYDANTGAGYRYVKVLDGVTVQGNIALWADDCTEATGLYACTPTFANSLGASINACAGIWTRANTQNYWTFIQVSGVCLVNTDGGDDFTAGSALTAKTATNGGTAEYTAANTAPIGKVVGFALAADIDALNVVIAELQLDV